MCTTKKSAFLAFMILTRLFSSSSVAGFDGVDPLADISVVAFDVPAFDLWNGTELEPLSLPEVDVLQESPFLNRNVDRFQQTLDRKQIQPDQNLIGGPSELKFKAQSEEPPLMIGRQPATSDLAFADPIDFEAWKLVKWTLLVLVIAGSATFFMRGKRFPSLNHSGSEKLQLVESLTVDVRTKIHLLSLDNERYLVATDLNGVKSMTLVPNWTSDSEHTTPIDESVFE